MKAIVLDIKKQLARLCSNVESMLALSSMMRGSFGTTYSRCGKPTCWCADAENNGHPCTKVMWTDEDGPKTRSVRDENKQIVSEAIGQYREFKELRRILSTEVKRLEEMLDVFERKSTIKSRTKMGYYKQSP
jgi:hypothetical protein